MVQLGQTLVRAEGATAFWAGLRPTLLMAVPSTVLYMGAYEHIRDAIQAAAARRRNGGGGALASLAPMLAGGSARVVTVVVAAPLELLRTRMQAAPAGGAAGGAAGGVGGALRAVVAEEGVLALWRGLSATLLRDVPFSCLYWVRSPRRDTSKTPPRQLRQDSSETAQRHIRDISETLTSETRPRHVGDTLETRPRHVPDTSQTRPRHSGLPRPPLAHHIPHPSRPSVVPRAPPAHLFSTGRVRGAQAARDGGFSRRRDPLAPRPPS